MNFLDRIREMDKLIKQESTGTAYDLSEKLNISKRTVFNYLKWMRQQGAPISYSNKKNSYIYEEDVEFVVAFVKPEGTL